MCKKLLSLSIFLLAHWWSGIAFSQEITSQGYLLSSQSDFSLSELESQDFVPYQGVLNRGYGNQYLWIKLRIAPIKASQNSLRNEDWIIRIRPSYLGEIALFDTLDVATGKNVPLIPQAYTGQRHSYANNGYDSINHGFMIFPSDKPRDVYLRLKTSTTRLISIEVMGRSKAYEEDRNQLALASVFLSLLAFFLIWSALQWLILRERLLALFFFKQLIVLIFGIAYLGYLKLLLGNSANWAVVDIFVKLNNFAYIGMLYIFEVSFLSNFLVKRRYSSYIHLPLVVWGLAVLLFIVGYESLAMEINMYVALLAPAFFLILASMTRTRSSTAEGEAPPLLSRSVLIMFYLFYVLAAYVVVLPNVGLIQAKELTLTSAIYVSIVSAALMTTLLIMRTRNLNRQKSAAEAAASISRRTLEQEQVHREQQSRFISMLTHELKTPISVAQISLDSMEERGAAYDRIQRTLHNMNDVVERCRISDAIEGARFNVVRQEIGLREAVFERIDLVLDPSRVKVFEGQDVFIKTDSQLVGIILSNLLDNALKYSPEGTVVTVHVSPMELHGSAGASIVITNEIGKVGIPDATKVFQKYYRSKAAEGMSGSGLGLYLTAGIADLLGGSVSYHSTESRWIEFRVWLPD